MGYIPRLNTNKETSQNKSKTQIKKRTQNQSNPQKSNSGGHGVRKPPQELWTPQTQIQKKHVVQRIAKN